MRSLLTAGLLSTLLLGEANAQSHAGRPPHLPDPPPATESMPGCLMGQVSKSCTVDFESAPSTIARNDTFGAQALTRVQLDGAPEPQANDTVRDPDLSGSGRRLVFSTRAANLIGGGTTAFQVMRLNLDDGSLRVLSRDPSGQLLATADCLGPVASGSGRYVAFETAAGNLVPGSLVQQIYRVDASTGVVLRVSESRDGAPGNDVSRTAAVSADGRHVAFHTLATNLVAADTNASADVLVKDLDSGAVELISRATDGSFAGDSSLPLTSQAMSADARYVVFSSPAANMVTGVGSGGGVAQVLLRDRSNGITTLISRVPGGAAADNVSDQAAISASARFVAFRSVASNLGSGSRVFLLDRTTGTLVPVPLPIASLFSPPLSASASACRDARPDNEGNVAMVCNMAGGAPVQAFLWRRSSNSFRLLSADRNVVNGLGNALSGNRVALDDSGVTLAFESQASNLVAGDTNATTDVFFAAAPLVSGPVLFADDFEPPLPRASTR